jgi:murein DD-endopeptidase MepM/ murein hydrolase activator NlpD
VTPTHNGVDIDVPVNTPVRAVTSGVVRYNTKDMKGYGNAAEIIDEKTGRVLSRDAHLNKFVVPEGTKVNVGDVIGLSGGVKNAPGAGNSSGPHVHHENFTQVKSSTAGAPTVNAVAPRNKSEYELQQKTETELAKKRAEVQMQEESDIRKAAGEKRGTLNEEDRAEFRTSTDPSMVDQQRAIGTAIEEKITGNPRIAGVFADPGVINAAGALLNSGVELGRLGTLRLNLEDAYLQAFDKKYGKMEASEREAVKTMFANLELAKSAIMKGQGPISDAERTLLQRATGSLSNKAETIIKTAKAVQLAAEFKETARNMYDDNRDKYKSFEDFYASKDYKGLVKDFGTRADRLNQEKIDLGKQSAAKTNPNVYSDPGKEALYQEYLKNRKAK